MWSCRMQAHGPGGRHVEGGIIPLVLIEHYPRDGIFMMVAKTQRHWNGFPCA